MKLTPFLCLMACLAVTNAPADTGDHAPELLGHDDPKWPFKLTFGDDGTAVLLFQVNTLGRVGGVKVMEASRPDMEEPCVTALLDWTFSPATRGGEPVSTYTEYSFKVNVLQRNSYGGYQNAGHRDWGVPPTAAPGAPPQFQYDQAPQPAIALPAVYPRDMLIQGQKGEATIAFTIDPTGTPRQFLLVGASRPEFGPPTIAMMKTWRFTPPLQDGRPCWAAVRMTQEFNLNDEDVETDDETERVVSALRDDPCPIVDSPKALDAPPVPRYSPSPVVPEAVVRSGETARAVVEIVIDRKGHAQVPKIISATSDDFGWAAATAAGRYIFTVPMKDGKPVDVFARLPMEYRPPRAAGPAGAPIAGLGIKAGNPKWGPFDAYLQGVAQAVRKSWERILGNAPDIRAPGGRVEVRFILTSSGDFDRIVWTHVSGPARGRASRACISAIMAGAPFGRWTPAMAAALGDGQEVTLTFEYQ